MTRLILPLSIVAGLFGAALALWLLIWGFHFYFTALPWPCSAWRCHTQQVSHD